MYLTSSSFPDLNAMNNGAADSALAPLPHAHEKSSGCKCGGKCGGNKQATMGVGDFSTAWTDIAAGNFGQSLTDLFTDPTSGGISWSTVAFVALGAYAVYKFMGRGVSGPQAELASARAAYNRKARAIRKQAPLWGLV